MPTTEASVAAIGQRPRATVAERAGLSPRLIWAALAIFLATRVFFVAITLAGLWYLRRPITPSEFLLSWSRYDVKNYAGIASAGYQTGPLITRAAFFPLQPLLAAALAPLAGGNTFISTMVVSNLAFIGALLGMGALARLDQGDAGAVRAMLLLALYPMAFFTFAGYSESIYLLCAIWTLVAVRRGWAARAGVMGLLATLARQMGLFLALPIAIDSLRRAQWDVRRLRVSVVAVIGPALGLALFCAWLWHAVGDPLAFAHVEAYWKHSFALPWVTFAQAIHQIPQQPYRVMVIRALVDFILTVIFFALIVAGARRLPLGETLYSLAVWLLVVCYPSAIWAMQSDARYMLSLVPCFLTLSWLTRKRWAFAATLALSVALLFLMSFYFARGYVII